MSFRKTVQNFIDTKTHCTQSVDEIFNLTEFKNPNAYKRIADDQEAYYKKYYPNEPKKDETFVKEKIIGEVIRILCHEPVRTTDYSTDQYLSRHRAIIKLNNHNWHFEQLIIYPNGWQVINLKIPFAFLAVVVDEDINTKYFAGGNTNAQSGEEKFYFFEPIQTKYFDIEKFSGKIEHKSHWNHTKLRNKSDNELYVLPLTLPSIKDELSPDTAETFGDMLDIIG
jgi:hypothetical protein